MKDKRIVTIPNLLSLIRLLLIPLFVWLYAVRRDYSRALLVLAISAVTDILDGQIARRFGMVSDLGKMLDPIADKVTQGVVLICLVTRFPAMWVPLVLLVVKEAFVGITNLMIIRQTGRVNGAAFHGKVATVFLDGLMLAHLLWGNMPAAVSVALVTLTTVFMLLSLWLYAMTNIAKLKRLQTRKTITALECEQKKEANVASGSQ